jgi:hypothetical protein
MLYANYNTTHTFSRRRAAKSQKPSETKAKKPTKTKSQVGMQMEDFSSKMQPEARSHKPTKPEAKIQPKKSQQKYPSPLHKGCASKQYPPWYVLTK